MVEYVVLACGIFCHEDVGQFIWLEYSVYRCRDFLRFRNKNDNGTVIFLMSYSNRILLYDTCRFHRFPKTFPILDPINASLRYICAQRKRREVIKNNAIIYLFIYYYMKQVGLFSKYELAHKSCAVSMFLDITLNGKLRIYIFSWEDLSRCEKYYSLKTMQRKKRFVIWWFYFLPFCEIAKLFVSRNIIKMEFGSNRQIEHP